MKTLLALLALLATLAPAQEERIVLIPDSKTPPPPPLMFAAAVDTTIRASLEKADITSTITFRIHQGRPETLTLPLTGEGDVLTLTGDGLRDWSVRRDSEGTRFLDVRPILADNPPFPETLALTLTAVSKAEGNTLTPLLTAPGTTTGYQLALTVTHDPTVKPDVTTATGLTKIAGDAIRFTTARDAVLALRVTPDGPAAGGIELADTRLTGALATDATTVSFTLTARATATRPGAKLNLLSGTAALSGGVSGDGWYVALDGNQYHLIAEREGPLDIRLTFDARVSRSGDWRVIRFALPGGVIVPVRLDGFPENLGFDPARTVVPQREGNAWQGFLPADGTADIAWRATAEAETGSLFFASSATADIRVGSGLLKQETLLELQVLQGRIDSLTLDLAGPGEILGVTGAAIAGWSVRDGEGGARLLELRLSRPIEGTATLRIDSQTALDALPVTTAALRIAPRDALRHSGSLRVASQGAVKIEVRSAAGLIQLAPAQFPGRPLAEGQARQQFVYRFPAAAHDYQIHASQVVPETGVSEITLYELGESDRRIHADIELDIREAPLREWNIIIPEGHAVAAVTGAAVADFTTAATPRDDGSRDLKIIFREAIQGRHLISLRLERNAGPEAGPWPLAPLIHPDARSRRGFVGALATAGYRLTPATTEGLAETPLTFFPKQTPGLQQAFRIREAEWAATLNVEALGQSVQADVFHLHSLKAGAAYGSVVINYFVVGAPATEWRVSVPADAGNVDVTGQNVGRDWRREGDTLVIPLSRPLAGAATLLVTYEQPMSTRGGSLSAGSVRPLNVQSERGFIQIVSPEQVKHTVTTEDGPLLAIDATELPAEFRVLSNAPTLAAWQYTGGGITTAIDVEWFAPGATVEQAIDHARLDTRVSRDGEWVTDASFFVKSAGRAALRMTLPQGTTLWETTIDGEPVNTREDNGALLVPLPTTSNPEHGVTIRVRYGARPENATKPVLTAPLLDAPVVFSEWSVSGDENRRLIPGSSRAGLVRPVRAESGWQWIARKPGPTAILIALIVLTAISTLGKPGPVRTGITRALFLATAAAAIITAAQAWLHGNAHAATLEFAAPVLAAGEALIIPLANVAPWRALISLPAILGLLIAVAVWVASSRGPLAPGSPSGKVPPAPCPLWKTLLRPLAIVIAAAALLSLHGGAPWFFIILALLCLVRLIPTRGAGILPAASLIFLMLTPNADASTMGSTSLIHTAILTAETLNPTETLSIFIFISFLLFSVTSVVLSASVIKKAHPTKRRRLTKANENACSGALRAPMPMPGECGAPRVPSGTAVIDTPLHAFQWPKFLPCGWRISRPRGWRVSRQAVAGASCSSLLFLLPTLTHATPLPPAESITQQWTLSEGRANATLDITLRGNAGDRFLLVAPPAILGEFTSADGALRVVKTTRDGSDVYLTELTRDGRATARAAFEMPLADPSQPWHLPTGPAALRRIDITWDQPGWEFRSDQAGSIAYRHTAESSAATLTLTPHSQPVIVAAPRPRDIASEETRFFAESHQVFLPGPGVVTGLHRFAIRPAQGTVDALRIQVPEGLTVSDVRGQHAGTWRFDAAARELRVAIEPAQAAGFAILVETQRGTDAPPTDLTLAPLRVIDAADDVGQLAIAFGSDTQPENVAPTGLSRINPEDPGPDLLPRDAKEQPIATVREAFRFGQADASLALRVAPVAPEIRSEIWQLVSLGEDRLLISTDVTVDITRAGLFRVELEIPAALEIESVTGPALGHWSERTEENTRRILTLHLTGRTLGSHNFAITLAGPAPAATSNGAPWSVPRITVAETARETGVITVVPERGLQTRVATRRNLSQIDPRELAGADRAPARAAARPGALAWRMLQADWALDLAIDRLDPWVTASVFHEATLREGQISERLAITWKIENAAIKSTRIRLPGLDDATAATVRATGPAVADLVRLTDTNNPDLWEIRFQRGIAGETTAEIEYQRLIGDAATTATLTPAELPGARQTTTFVAIRAGGRLDLTAPDSARGWQRTDWAVIRAALGRRVGDAPPRFAFRVADSEGPLTINFRRHNLAELRRLRVTSGLLTTLLAPDGATLTAVSLDMAATAKTTLRLRLPEGADLFNVFVNEEGAPLVREDGDWLFHVSPSPDSTRPANVRFVYSGKPGTTRLEGPTLDVPMENLRWHVLVPDGWKLSSHKGDFDLRRTVTLGQYEIDDYQSLITQHRKEGKDQAAELLDKAGAWMQSGQQDLAAAALSNVMRNRQLDEASNEDARVQLRELKTQQAVLGLNTRRQRVALDNGMLAPEAVGDQLQRAADANPLLQGTTNYDPAQFDRLLEGNTADELTALKEIAARIVSQQLATDPAPAAIDPTLPERGTRLEFDRAVQIDGDRPMTITLKLRKASQSGLLLALSLCLTVSALTRLRP